MTVERFCFYCGTRLEAKGGRNGHSRLFCPACHAKFYKNPIPAVAALVVERGTLLLVRRAVPPFEGSWCLPGGFVESGEDVRQALFRELFEETGLKGRDAILIDVASFVDDRPEGKGVIILGYRVNAFEGSLRPGDDAKDARFFDLNTLPAIPFSTHRALIAVLQHRGMPRESILSQRKREPECRHA